MVLHSIRLEWRIESSTHRHMVVINTFDIAWKRHKYAVFATYFMLSINRFSHRPFLCYRTWIEDLQLITRSRVKPTASDITSTCTLIIVVPPGMLRLFLSYNPSPSHLQRSVPTCISPSPPWSISLRSPLFFLSSLLSVITKDVEDSLILRGLAAGQ